MRHFYHYTNWILLALGFAFALFGFVALWPGRRSSPLPQSRGNAYPQGLGKHHFWNIDEEEELQEGITTGEEDADGDREIVLNVKVGDILKGKTAF